MNRYLTPPIIHNVKVGMQCAQPMEYSEQVVNQLLQRKRKNLGRVSVFSTSLTSQFHRLHLASVGIHLLKYLFNKSTDSKSTAAKCEV